MNRSAVLFAIAGVAIATSAKADVVLTVDVTNLNDVLFASTGAAASASSTGAGYLIQLSDILLTSGGNQGNFSTGDLNTPSGDVQYDIFGGIGLSIRVSFPGHPNQTFIAGQPAFAGSENVDLSFLNFKPAGTIGDIHVLDNFGQPTGIVIGQYQIVPAPGAAAVLGLAGLVATRRRR